MEVDIFRRSMVKLSDGEGGQTPLARWTEVDINCRNCDQQAGLASFHTKDIIHVTKKRDVEIM